MNAHNMQLRGQHIAPVYLDRKVPRLQILCGSRLKPEMAVKTLRLANVRHEDILNGKRVGRVDIISGDYRYENEFAGGKVRILVGETQMGLDAVDIIQREYIHAADGSPVVQIRAGTCGGNNSKDLEEPVMKLGDIVIARMNIGSSGAIMQSLGYFPKIIPNRNSKKARDTFLAQWAALGGSVTSDGRFLRMPNDGAVVLALANAAKHFQYSYHIAANFSKESLYGEDAAKIMFDLRKSENVLCSEMEQLQNAYIAAIAKAKHNIHVLTGMVVAVIGAIPGPGFPDRNDKAQMKLQETTEENTLRIAADALARFSKRKWTG